MNRPTRTLFLLFAMLCGFCITSEYSIIKPTSHSCFIASYGTRYFPLAWLAILPLNFFLVTLYNRLVYRLGCFKTLALTTASSIAINLFSAFFLKKIFILPFLLYIWKDLYILLLFQQLWSLIHATDLGGGERFWYGMLFGAGGLGSILGSLIPGYFAAEVGSEHLLLAALPFALLLTLFYYGLTKQRPPLPAAQKEGEKGGWKLLAHSRPLKVILTFVVLMQVSATLIEYQFHQHIQSAIPEQDLRTAYLGKLFSSISSVNLFFHFIGTQALVKLVGLRRAHFIVPSILAANTVGFLITPKLGMVSYNYGTIKVFDYSLFAILKEMLYVPLKQEEKFKAKALIDVFAYRSSKALASLLLFLIPIALLSWTLLACFILWLFTAKIALKPESDGAAGERSLNRGDSVEGVVRAPESK